MVTIPQNLKDKNFRFVLIRSKTKKPYEHQWQQTNNYSQEHKKLLEYKGNVGVICGYGGLVVLDIDNKDFIKYFDEKLNTFTVETGSGGRHYYFICNESFAKCYYVLNNKAGELRVKNSQVVMPGSIHPNGNAYKIINDIPVNKISKLELRKLLNSFLVKEVQCDNSRSGKEWGEVCSMINAGYNYEDCDNEMRVLGYRRWVESNEGYRVGTYCNALKSLRRVR